MGHFTTALNWGAGQLLAIGVRLREGLDQGREMDIRRPGRSALVHPQSKGSGRLDGLVGARQPGGSQGKVRASPATGPRLCCERRSSISHTQHPEAQSLRKSPREPYSGLALVTPRGFGPLSQR